MEISDKSESKILSWISAIDHYLGDSETYQFLRDHEVLHFNNTSNDNPTEVYSFHFFFFALQYAKL